MEPFARTVLAIFAHPDDLEFVAAGTLLLLKQAGWEPHYWNLCSGNCGSETADALTTRRVREAEAQRACELLGATWHPPIADDLELLYSVERLRQVTAVIRAVRPGIILTHALADYMEDHMQAARLAVTAAFARGMPNFETTPPTSAAPGQTALYHALPHGLRDGMGQTVRADIYVNMAAALDQKRAALAAHVSQKTWLDVSQGMDSYLAAMEEFSRAVAAQTPHFAHAEGWRRHNPLGFSTAPDDPLTSALAGQYWRNHDYQRAK